MIQLCTYSVFICALFTINENNLCNFKLLTEKKSAQNVALVLPTVHSWSRSTAVHYVHYSAQERSLMWAGSFNPCGMLRPDSGCGPQSPRPKDWALVSSLCPAALRLFPAGPPGT